MINVLFGKSRLYTKQNPFALYSKAKFILLETSDPNPRIFLQLDGCSTDYL